MEIVLFGVVTFAVVFGGGLLGLLLGRFLPEQYHNDATQKIVQTAAGMVSLIAALVLGLLVATAKGKFDTTAQRTQEFASKLMLINRELVNFGPEAVDARALLRKYTVAKIAVTWPGEGGTVRENGEPPPWKLLESLEQNLIMLEPHSEMQRYEKAAASGAVSNLENATWLQVAQESAHVQQPFIVMLVLWLFVLFVSFGLFAPRNGLVVAALLVGSLAISGAVLLIVDMDLPYEGLFVVSPHPMKLALGQMSEP